MSRPALVAAVITAYAVAASVTTVLLLDAGTDPVAVGALGLVAALGLGAGVHLLLHRGRAAVDRLAEEVHVIAVANPAHRVPSPGAGTLAGVTAAVNRLAGAREASLRAAETSAEDLRHETESERNRLADLMARLGVAVVACNADGRVLLYNESARDLVGDPSLLGLGRTVFGLVDRGLIAHAYRRLEAGEDAHTATTLHHGRMLRVHVAPVHEARGPSPTGLVLVLEDLTHEAGAADERQRALRGLVETLRGSLGSLRAATEALLEFPDSADADRRRLRAVIEQEADRLATTLDQASSGARPGSRQDLEDVSADDVAAVVEDHLGRIGVRCRARVSGRAEQVWLHADPHALAAVLAVVARRLGGPDLGAVELDLTHVSQHVRLDLRWEGDEAPSTAVLAGWLAEPLGPQGATTGQQVVERHGAEVWAGQDEPGRAHLSVLLPHPSDGADPDPGLVPTVVRSSPGAVPPSAIPGSRPEFYDFDLSTSAGGEQQSAALLTDLAFTVLDTETTGLDPAGGDRIVSLGAVRVVNGRVLRQETFEQLVDPGRRVPAAATAIHGLTEEMLAGAPRIEEVLPALVRFADDTVVVGHDLGFDLRFLEAAGVTITHPVLDTLLLDATLFPAQEDHTLEAIARRLGVSVVGRHTALGDALVTADVLVRLLGPLGEAGIRTLDDALAASRRAFRGRATGRSTGS